MSSTKDLESLIELSKDVVCLVFKHSTRCTISSRVLRAFEDNLKASDMKNEVRCFYLDLIAYRALSDEISNLFEVKHESPQVLVINKGNCIYHCSHAHILASELYRNLSKLN